MPPIFHIAVSSANMEILTPLGVRSWSVMVNLVHLISFNMFPSNQRAREFLRISNEIIIAKEPQLSEIADYEQCMPEDKRGGIALVVAAKELSERTTILNGTVIHGSGWHTGYVMGADYTFH